MRNYRVLLRMAFVALTLGLSTSALAEWKGSYNTQANNVGLTVQSNGYGGPIAGSHQFPRGSGNIWTAPRWNWGPMAIRDLDGNGSAEDTMGFPSRAGTQIGMNSSLESKAELEALWNGGEMMDQASGRIDHNRVLVSSDAEDLADWYPEFREGRTASGAPILNGAETVVVRFGDSFMGDGFVPHGTSMEYRFNLLNFAESNNMVYGHCVIRNMSEYLKWNPHPDVRARMDANPNGFAWKEWTLTYAIAGGGVIGARDEGWGFYNPTAQHVITDRNGIENSFTGAPFMVSHVMIRPPSHNGETMKASNLIEHAWTCEFGFCGSIDVCESGFSYSKAFRVSLGGAAGETVFPGVISPWNGKPLHGWPGLLEPTDGRYNQWIWGEQNAYNTYQFWGSLHDFEPQDTTSFDFALMFLYATNPNMALPRSELQYIDDPAVQEHFAPALTYAGIAKVVMEGGLILPQTPESPSLTVIPGNRQVTITWSDVNINTPDAYYGFLQQHPELDPNGTYREFDFEGYRLYRSFVGPSDSHSELIWEGSIGGGDLAFFYVDSHEKDQPLYRLSNGMKVWYALVPYDKNYDPATGVEFSLPKPESGKIWNRPGPGGLYTVQPRGEASNFKPASLGEQAVFISGAGVTPLAQESAELTGDGSGKLTQAPAYLVPRLGNLELIPVNSERIKSDRDVFITVTSMDVTNWGGCNWPTATRTVQMVEGANQTGVTDMFQVRDGVSDKTVILNGPVGVDGVDYAMSVEFAGLDQGDLYYDWNAGSYVGAAVAAATYRCGADIKSAPNNLGWARSAQFTVTWRDAGNGNLTLEIINNTINQSVAFGQFPDDYGWGIAEGGIIGDRWGAGDNLYNEMVAGLPKDERTSKMTQTIAADNTGDFGIYLNGIYWMFSGITAMPAAGTSMIVTTAFGSWNADKTIFTQPADPAFPGDKWQVKLKAMTMNAEDADLSKVKVVPNPYLASSWLDLSPNSRRIEFVNLPDRCTIRVYSLGGHLVNVLNHIGNNRQGWGDYTDWDRLDANSQPRVMTGYDNHGGTEPWNLRNRFGQTVASGLYFFHVTDARGETSTGKFYIIN